MDRISESELPYASLHQLLRLELHRLAAIPEAQTDALRRRQAVHQVLAESLPADDDQRVWHHSVVAIGPEDRRTGSPVSWSSGRTDRAAAEDMSLPQRRWSGPPT